MERDVVAEYRDKIAADDKWAFLEKWDFSFSEARYQLVDAMNLKGGEKILDVGAANGATLKYIKERYDCRLYGIEPESKLAKEAVKYGKIYVGTVENWLHSPFEDYDSQYDFIIMADVIEHLLEPWAIVRDIAKHLKKSGAIFASIPNFLNATVIVNLFKYGTFGYKSCDIVNKEHLRFFTTLDCMDLFKICGLKPEILGGIAACYAEGTLEAAKLFTEIFKRSDYNIDSYQLCFKATKP